MERLSPVDSVRAARESGPSQIGWLVFWMSGTLTAFIVALCRRLLRRMDEARDAAPQARFAAEASLAFDRQHKGGLYARAHVPDYWIVNLVDHVLEVYRDPAASADAPYGWRFSTRLRLGPADHISPLAASRARGHPGRAGGFVSPTRRRC